MSFFRTVQKKAWPKNTGTPSVATTRWHYYVDRWTLWLMCYSILSKRRRDLLFFPWNPVIALKYPSLTWPSFCVQHIATLYRHMTNIMGESLKGKVLQVLVKWVIATTLSTKEAFNKDTIIQKWTCSFLQFGCLKKSPLYKQGKCTKYHTYCIILAKWYRV